MIIIDSLNGVYNMFDDLDSVRFVNSSHNVTCVFRKTIPNSSVIITAMARKKTNKEWVLSPGGTTISEIISN